jgi:hypothetical protein
MDLRNFLWGIVYSVLPKEYWRALGFTPGDLALCTEISGILESLCFAILLGHRYVGFLVLRTQQLHPLAAANEGTQLYLWIVLTLEYLFHPAALILGYFGLEGAVRFASAFLTGEILPSLPFKVFALVLGRRKNKALNNSYGPVVPDECNRSSGAGYDLRIACSRPKDGWRPSITVAVGEEFYELVRQEQGKAPRLFIYFLQKLPPGKVIRGLYRYPTEEV